MIIVPLSIFLTVAVVQNNAAEIVPVEVREQKEVIKVFPTPGGKGSISVHSGSRAALSFYLFDLEGTLVYQSIIKKNEKQTIGGLNIGTYIYNAFQNDENLEGGQVTVK